MRQTVFLLTILPFWTNGLVRIFSWTMLLRQGGILDDLLHVVAPGARSVGLLYSFPAIVIGLVHAYLPYMILTCYLAVAAIDDALIDGRPQPRGAAPHRLRHCDPAARPARPGVGRDPDLRARHRQLHGAAHPRGAHRRHQWGR